jgi:HAE1 family hydrophobic/amphiphilic exporter-1
MIKTFIARPVFTTMFVMVLVFFGVIAYPNLGMDLYPEIELPYVNVTIIYEGASPEEMETLVTKQVEDAVSSVSGIRTISSMARESYSQTTIEFELGIDPRQAASEVREKVAGIRRRLPDNIDEPVVQRFDISSQPILAYTFSSEIRERGEIRKIIEDVIVDELQMLDGVAEAAVLGASPREIQVLVDPRKLDSYNISLQDILNIVNEQNLNIPGGKVKEAGVELTVRTLGKYRNVEDIKAIVIANQNGRLIHLGEVADVVDTWQEARTYSRTNGTPSVGVLVRKQSGTNTVAVSDRVEAAMASLLANDLPPDFNMATVRDQAFYIKENVNDVWNAILVGGALALLITYFFLRDFRATVVGGMAIPTSIVATFALMRWQGFTLNNMSLMGLSLAVGILIDDAIVIIENIYRHMQMGKSNFQASYQATTEISLAILATTFSLLAVFVPIGSMGDIVGQFFKQFGLTVAFSIAFSILVAFTLTPMLSAHWLKNIAAGEDVTDRPKFLRIIMDRFEEGFQKSRELYLELLRWAMSRPKTVFAIAALSLAVNLFLTPFMGTEFQPTYDSGEFAVSMKAPAGTSIEKMISLSAPLEKTILAVEGVKTVNLNIGGSRRPVYEGSINVKLVPASERSRTMPEIMDELRAKFRDVTGLKVAVLSNQGGGRGDQRPVQIGLRGSDLDELTRYANETARLLRNVPGAADVDLSSSEFEPEVMIRLDPDKAAAVGANTSGIGGLIETAFSGNTTVNSFTIGDENYNIRVRLNERYRMNINDVKDIRVPAANGTFVRLGDIAEVIFTSGPTQIDREDRQRQIIVYANAVGTSPGELLDRVSAEIMPQVNMPLGYRYKFVGQGDFMATAFREISRALVIAIVMIYMVLAAQFESFTQPVIIMLSLPFSVVGAILGLLMAGQTINMISLIGIIMLMGVVTKTAILLVDYANQRREEGHNIRDSLIEAASLRLRPILMTTLSTILAMMPIALGIGEGAELRQSMGVAMVGGLTTSTLLTLIVVPMGYLVLEEYKEKRGASRRARE